MSGRVWQSYLLVRCYLYIAAVTRDPYYIIIIMTTIVVVVVVPIIVLGGDESPQLIFLITISSTPISRRYRRFTTAIGRRRLFITVRVTYYNILLYSSENRLRPYNI